MSKLYFKHGTMNSGKTAELIMTVYNYRKQGKKTLVFKPSVDTRWSEDNDNKHGKIISRALNTEISCRLVAKDESIRKLFEEESNSKVVNSERVHAVIIDEAQFLSKEQVKELAILVDETKIPVICFGLKNSFVDGALFEGSSALLYYAEKIEEIKTVCQFCDKKATMNLLLKDGKPVYEGSGVQLGDVSDDGSGIKYIQVCRHHYWNPNI